MKQLPSKETQYKGITYDKPFQNSCDPKVT